jgi:hypothetical protein
MEAVKVSPIRATLEQDAHGAAGIISVGSKHHDIWFRVLSGGPAADGNESFFSTAFLPAMIAGGGLQVDVPVSSRLLGQSERIQEVFHIWDRGFKRIEVVAPQRSGVDGLRPDRGVGCFFSGGVDSFYSVMKHQEEITHLILVRGFDIPLHNGPLWDRVRGELGEVAADLQKSLIVVETNLRSFTGQYLSWDFANGAGLASVAQLLAPQLRKVYIGSSHSYAELFPWGSHPLIDPLWGTEDVEIVHDGCEASRTDKVALIVNSDVAMRSLRVCWVRPEEYNCGECEKCVRTMVNLRIEGALEKCTTFKGRRLKLWKVALAALEDENSRSMLRDNLRAAEEKGTDAPLLRALRIAMSQRYDKGLWGVARRIRSRVLKSLAGE